MKTITHIATAIIFFNLIGCSSIPVSHERLASMSDSALNDFCDTQSKKSYMNCYGSSGSGPFAELAQQGCESTRDAAVVNVRRCMNEQTNRISRRHQD